VFAVHENPPITFYWKYFLKKWACDRRQVQRAHDQDVTSFESTYAKQTVWLEE